MCGITGLLTFRPFRDVALLRTKLEAMSRSIAHRGPDAEGYWLDDAQGVALGHCRLSILDLSSSGAQPMQSACGRYQIAYNGEIYNHLRLRGDLEEGGLRTAWKGHSDTETLLAAISEWGLERALQKSFGMFAFALWDRKERVLSLARDRMGEKPLYYAQQDNGWLFGSELRALRAGGLVAEINQPALASYLKLGYVPDHLCILNGVRKVMPGSIIQLRAEAEPAQIVYASIEAEFGRPTTLSDPKKATQRLETVLEEVVGDQMISDVPLGCFLSGGVDSSLVASLMQSGSDRQVQTFSIGFDDPRFNEAPHAKAVADRLGTQHSEFVLKEDDALAIVEGLPRIYDEPFADSSQIPTTLLCRSARQHVTVALTGDGGDEVFGGYNRHIRGPGLWNKITRLPGFVRSVGAGVVDGAAQWGLRSERISRFATSTIGLPLTTLENLPKLATALRSADNADDFYQAFISTDHAFGPGLMEFAPTYPADPRARDPSGMDMAEWIMACDTTGYLPGDILVKVDRASMSVGLETRAPFLDARVARVARQIPTGLHVDSRKGKKLLRDLLYRHVPQALIERPKQGFAMPLDDWLRGALSEWGAKLIMDRERVAGLGLNSDVIENLWQRHQDARVNAGKELWTLMMLLLWAKDIGIGAYVKAERPDQSPEMFAQSGT